MRIVICGGGVIGASIAYFLGRRGVASVVVERTALACAASGKSGGFLALDWCDGTPLQELARRSFALHAGLSNEIPGDWGFRRMETYGGIVEAKESVRRRNSGVDVGWISGRVTIDRRLGNAETTAQVHPEKFAAALMRAAEAKGAEFRIGNATGLVRSRDGTRVEGVTIDGEVLPADAVVIAMGPWSILAAGWLTMPVVFGLKGHSLIFETGDRIPAEALFLEYEAPDGALSPEIFPRPDGTIWACAISSESPLPVDPAAVAPDPGAMERLEVLCRSLSPVLAKARILARQACFRPITQDGLPLIGAAPGLAGAYVATGHSVWGILNAPATGEAMAELILDRAARNIDLAPFDPQRLRPFDAKRMRIPVGA